MKFPKLDGFQYFGLRAAGLVIGGATVIYVVCANVEQVMGVMEVDRPLEGAIKWKLMCLLVYTSWIYGIVMEQSKYLKYVLILWFGSILYTLFHLFILLALVVRDSDSDENMHDKAVSSLCSILLKTALFSVFLCVHWIVYKLMQKATADEAEGNEGNSLLKKVQNPVQPNETNDKKLSENP